MLSVADGGLRDGHSPGAQALQSALRELCTASPNRLPGSTATSRVVHGKQELTQMSVEVPPVTKLWMLCRTRMISVTAAGVSQTELSALGSS